MRWSHFRDTVLFFGGLAGVAHETFFHASDRPELLIIYAGMMGLPAFFQADSQLERRREREEEEDRASLKKKRRGGRDRERDRERHRKDERWGEDDSDRRYW